MARSPSLRRLAALVAAGVVTGGVVALWAPWQLAMLAGWIASGVTYLAIAWTVIARADGARTYQLATIEDDSRAVSGLIVVAAATVSLVGAALALHRAADASEATSAVLTGASVVTVVVSWLMINTDFTLRYAHLYHSDPAGGIEFTGVDTPDYRDFAYVAFTVGMTYQVSDTGLLSPRFRRVLLGHALVSYLFGAVIVASMISIMAGLLN